MTAGNDHRREAGMIRERGNALHVQVYAGRDPLTGKKRYKSKLVKGTGRAS
jgi:hypothetical protein